MFHLNFLSTNVPKAPKGNKRQGRYFKTHNVGTKTYASRVQYNYVIGTFLLIFNRASIKKQLILNKLFFYATLKL